MVLITSSHIIEIIRNNKAIDTIDRYDRHHLDFYCNTKGRFAIYLASAAIKKDKYLLISQKTMYN